MAEQLLRLLTHNTLEAAEELIGCLLVRRIGHEELVVRITETEAYGGSDDPASHAYRGRTPRNLPMFGPPGRLYVYFSYGMHYCMNVVTETDGVPGAVLLRGAVPEQGTDTIRRLRNGAKDRLLLNGPGKLAQGLAIDLGLNGYDLLRDPEEALRLVPGRFPAGSGTLVQTPRIGISKGIELPWRFLFRPDAASRENPPQSYDRSDWSL